VQLREVKVQAIREIEKECVVFLEEKDGIRLLPIWVGNPEGQAIAIKLSGVELPRPQSHDLLLASVEAAGFLVSHVVVADLRENVYYARLHLVKDAQTVDVDARPSDAIAVAVRAGAPIYVEESVFRKARLTLKPISADELERFKRDLQRPISGDLFEQLDRPAPREG
jgi:bifunctional DNase/RNase